MTEEELNQTFPHVEPGDEARGEAQNEQGEAQAPGDELEALRRQLAEREAAYADLEGQMRRLAADFDNYRRRQSQERENLVKFAGERILERFLDVMDNFERALDAGRKATNPEDVVKGVEMIHRQLTEFLGKEGVVAMDAKGQPFDPNHHEAVVQTDVDDVPDQTILDEFRRGYMMNGRVLRHAMVRIASNPSMPAGTTPESPSAEADPAQQP